jgi:hypothetical protein
MQRRMLCTVCDHRGADVSPSRRTMSCGLFNLPLPVTAFGRFFVWLDSFDTAVPQGMVLFCKQRYASEAMPMSDQDDWEFAGPDDAKAEIRAAVGYQRRPR